MEATGKRAGLTLNYVEEVFHLVNVCKLVARRKREVDWLD